MHIINGGRGTVCSYMNHMCTIAFLCEKKKGVRPLELLQTVGYKTVGSHCVDARNRTCVLCKGSKCS